MSPAIPSSRVFWNTSTPVMVEFFLAPKPMISTGSPTLTLPRSIRPVPTVPRPLIEKTSSIGIRNGLSISRTGSGMYSSIALTRSRIGWAALGSLGVVQGRAAAAADDRDLVAGELVVGQQLAELQLDQLEQLLVVDQVDLVEEDDQGRDADLAGQQDVLAGLGHRAVGRRDDQDRPVHLGRAGDHVLDVVGVARAVDVGVVPLVAIGVVGLDRQSLPPADASASGILF